MLPRSWFIDAVSLPDGERVVWGVVDGRLVADPPHRAERLPGRFVLAGLVDAHCHLALAAGAQGPIGLGPDRAADNLTALVGTGVTAIRETGAPRSITLHLVPRPGDPEVLACGRFLAPRGGYFPGVHDPVEADELVEAALAEIASGARWLKLVGDFPAGADLAARSVPTYDVSVVRRLVQVAHAAGARVAVHTTTGHVNALVEAGVDSVEHGNELDLDGLRALGEQGGAWTPTLCASLAPLPQDAPADRRHQWEQRRDQARELLPRAAHEGVTLLTGSDVIGSVAREIALLIECGLPPQAALAAASTSARAFLGLPGLSVGEPADLVTFDVDPREDPEALTRPAAVLRVGHRVA